MATISKLQVELSLIDKMSAGLKTVGSNLDAIGDKATKVGRTLTFGVTLPIAGVGIAAIKAASDLDEAMSATETVFGKNGKAVIDWSETTSKHLGISQSDALTAANQFAALGQAAGLTSDELVPFSQNLITAASDLSSFWNVPTSSVLEDLRSGLVGEYEPLRKYGILLDEASVNQRAMADTGKTNADQLTAGEKAAARYKLILEQLGPAQGDFVRTQDSLANKTRIAKAELEDAAAVLGEQLIPKVTALVDNLTVLIQKYDELDPKAQKVITALGAIAAVVGPLALTIGFVASNVAAFTYALGAVVSPIAGFVTGANLLTRALGPLLFPIIAIKKNLFGLGDAFDAVVETARRFGAELKTGFDTLSRTASSTLTAIATAFTTKWGEIKSTALRVIGEVRTGVNSTMSAMIAAAKAWLNVLYLAFKGKFEDIYSTASESMTSIKEKVGGVLNQIAGAVWDKAWSIGYNIGSGIIGGIESIWNAVISKAEALADAVLSILRRIPGISSPSKVTTYYGKMIGQGLIEGMEASIPGVRAAAAGIAGSALGGMTTYTGGISISVNGAGDPDAVADRVFSRFAREVALHAGGV